MRQYKKGKNRQQPDLFPPSLDEQIAPNNRIRAIDAYINTLDLNQMGFKLTEVDSGRGQPPYNPAMLLKLYLYGYIERIRSSRRLERESRRNLEVMWLTDSQYPSYKTIADFRKNNSKALLAVNKDFLLLCRELDLFGKKCIAVDGSYFRGNVSKASIVTANTLKKEITAIEKKILAYQQAMDQNDQEEQQEATRPNNEDPDLAVKLKKLQQIQQEKQNKLKQIKQLEQTQYASVDPDARRLSKAGQHVAGYNVQIAVDAKNHLIAASEVSNAGNDLSQLHPVSKQAKENLEADKIEVLADGGYYEKTQIVRCEKDQITPWVPISQKSSCKGRYPIERFSFQEEENHYLCPAGNILAPLPSTFKKNGKTMRYYQAKSQTCRNCSEQEACLGKQASKEGTPRRIARWEKESKLNNHKKRMKTQDAKTKKEQRSALVEHVFGTLKTRAGWSHHFLVRGFEKVRGEFSLMVLGYNFTRVLNTKTLQAFMDYCAQRTGKAVI